MNLTPHPSYRRAKAKLQDGRTGRGKSAELPPDSPPQLSTGFEVDLHNLIHEDERKPVLSLRHSKMLIFVQFCQPLQSFLVQTCQSAPGGVSLPRLENMIW